MPIPNPTDIRSQGGLLPWSCESRLKYYFERNQGVGMDRSQKADLVAELKSVFTETSVVVVTRNLGLTVAQSTDLRLKMRDAGAQFKVAKNKLAVIALEGTRYGPIGHV